MTTEHFFFKNLTDSRIFAVPNVLVSNVEIGFEIDSLTSYCSGK